MKLSIVWEAEVRVRYGGDKSIHFEQLRVVADDLSEMMKKV